MEANTALKTDAMCVDVFSPKHTTEKKDVFIFLHGGGWDSGHKSLYSFFGKRLARKGVVSIIVDYPLSPKVTYNEQAAAAAMVVKWAQQNIDKYSGDPKRIFISGHSAGGHLATLIAVRENYFDTLGIKNPLKGVVLIDAAGLDMYTYLMEHEAIGKDTYMDAFTKNHAVWKAASPIYHLHKGMPPMLILRGGKTYPSIESSTEKFVMELPKYNATPRYKVVKGKHHIAMIFQFLNSRNPLYKDILNFMKEQK